MLPYAISIDAYTAQTGRSQRPELASGVMRGVQRFQPIAGNVRVDLGGRNVGMAEQQLHDPQVGAVIE